MALTINPVAFNLFGWEVYWYGIIIFLAMLLGYFLANKEMIKKGFGDGVLMDMMFYIIIFSLVGARLYFVLFNIDYYLSHPLEIFAVWEGGMAIHGGLIGGVLAGLYFTKKNGYSFFQFADMLIPSVLLGQAIGRWGNFINQEAHGGPVSRAFLEKLPIPEFIVTQMNIEGIYYHPTFLYESVWNIVGVLILLVLRPKLRIGETLFLYMIYYSVGRFFIEGMRTDSLMFFGVLRTAQLMSIALIVLAIVMWIYRARVVHPPRYGTVYGNLLENKSAKQKRKTVQTVKNKNKRRKK